MNKDIKARWVAALRSGEYQQTRKRLHRVEAVVDDDHGELPVGFCCLGVLCDLALKEGVVTEGGVQDGFLSYLDNDGFGEASTLPNVVKDWAGLPHNNPEVRIATLGASRRSSLAEANDEGAGFADIADLIEDQF